MFRQETEGCTESWLVTKGSMPRGSPVPPCAWEYEAGISTTQTPWLWKLVRTCPPYFWHSRNSKTQMAMISLGWGATSMAPQEVR